jgi:hypothetical protein
MHEALRTPSEIVDLALKPKPQLVIHGGNLPATVEALRDLLASSERLFDRGVPVRFVRSSDGGPHSAIPLTRNNVVIETHRVCQPLKVNAKGDLVEVTLSDRVAQMYLDMVGEWNLQPLVGISMSPLLGSDGSFRGTEGYDRATGLWCCRVPTLTLPQRPLRAEAEAALRTLRLAFRTFPFSDSARSTSPGLGIEVVDISTAPGRDESAFLVSLLTACCRSSLWLAPGMLLSAPTLSGAGSGKGLLVRAICIIAFGIRPRAFTTGSDRQELDKRLAAELVEAHPALFLDNANGVALRSDTLASVLTERPARVRLLGHTRMVPLNSTAFMAVTGNGLSLSEDLARRFICCELDARCEDPELRPFPSGFLDQIEDQRAELLAAALTIWRWGRQNATALPKGKPLGSFETWAEWSRDPLLALGCRDPVERIEALKARDPRRQRIAELFTTWWDHHTDSPMKVSQLADPVKTIADPQGKGRQYLAAFMSGLAGTHAGGFVLTRQEAAGKWNPATYALKKTDPTEGTGHRTHRTHRAENTQALEPAPDNSQPMAPPTNSIGPMPPMGPMGPMGPMPYGPDDEPLPAGEQAVL